MTPTELAYLAGIVDGEGNIAIAKKPARAKSGEKTSTHWNYVKISNCDIRLLNWVLSVTGRGTISQESRAYTDNRRNHFTWIITSVAAASLLHEIYPYLVIKKDQANVVFRFRQTFSSRRSCRFGIPDWVSRERNVCYEELRRLHHVEHDGGPRQNPILRLAV